MEHPVIIFGANYLGRTAKEIFESNDVVVYGFLDDNKKLHNTEIDDLVVLGSTDDDGFLKLIGKKCEAFVAVDDNKLRKNIVAMLHDIRHVQPVNATHRNALVSPRTEMGHGNFFDTGFTSGPATKIGNHCLFHAHCHLGAETAIGNFVQVGAGTMVSSSVTIEDEVFIGAGATLIAGITVGKGARIGAGSVVIGSVKAGETVFGNPAQKIKQ
jgi:sugar O-acyltransferase (sialic acid O-acetyltransferase NeuD family)